MNPFSIKLWSIPSNRGIPTFRHPGDSHRYNFTEVVMLPVLRAQLKVINKWLEDEQVEEVVKQLTASFPGTDLIKNNRHVFTLLLENTSASENRRTSEKSPTVRFVDFTHRDNNRYIAVCQIKVRILGTEHHVVPDIRRKDPSGRRVQASMDL